MGPARRVFSHVIVPTCFSIMMDEERHAKIDQIIRKRGAMESVVLTRQDDVTTCCAICQEPIPVLGTEPIFHKRFQLAVRIIGALENTDNITWSYDMCFGILCRICQTSVWRNLMLISEEDYVAFAEGISECAFSEPISVEQFMDPNRYGPDPTIISSMGLTDSYLYRLERLNTFRAHEFMTMIQRDLDDAMVCQHCARSHHNYVVPCPGCGMVWYCNRPSTDHRFGKDKTCLELSAIYHGPVCQKISKDKIFYCSEAWYVDRRDHATVRCFWDSDDELEDVVIPGSSSS